MAIRRISIPAELFIVVEGIASRVGRTVDRPISGAASFPSVVAGIGGHVSVRVIAVLARIEMAVRGAVAEIGRVLGLTRAGAVLATRGSLRVRVVAAGRVVGGEVVTR